MNQPAAKPDLRSKMPMTADWVERKRLEWGKAHVDGCIRDAMKGVPGRFYAIEGGHVLGTPFPAGHEVGDWQRYATTHDCAFAVFALMPAAAHQVGSTE